MAKRWEIKPLPSRLFTRQQAVPCYKCEQEAGLAGDGECAYLGDGNGNYRLACRHCGWRNIFDLTKSADRAAEHMKELAAYFQAVAEGVRRVFADKRASKTKQPPAASQRIQSSIPAPTGDSVFAGLDLGAMITQEVRKIKRQV